MKLTELVKSPVLLIVPDLMIIIARFFAVFCYLTYIKGQ